MNTLELDRTNQQKEKKRRHKRQRQPTCSHTVASHRNTKLKAIIYMERTENDFLNRIPLA